MDKEIRDMLIEVYGYFITTRYEKKIEILSTIIEERGKIKHDIIELSNAIHTLKYRKDRKFDFKFNADGITICCIDNLDDVEIGTMVNMLESRKKLRYIQLSEYDAQIEKLREKIKFFEDNKEAILKGEIKYE